MSQTLKDEAPELAKTLPGWRWQRPMKVFDEADVVMVSTGETCEVWFFIRIKDAKATTGARAQRFAAIVREVVGAGNRNDITPRVRRQLLVEGNQRGRDVASSRRQ